MQLENSLNPSDKSVLYVDAEETNLKLFKRGFRRSYKVHTAQTGDQALEILRSKTIDLIIANSKAGNMKGTELLALTYSEFPDLVRIIMTGNTNTDLLMEEIKDVPIYKCVLKPYNKEDLEKTLNEALS